MAKVTIPFGGITRDTPLYGKAGMNLIQDMIPLSGNALGPSRNYAVLGNALADRVSGVASGQSSAGAYFIYAGTKTKLYEADSTYTFTDQSVGGGYTLGDADYWEIFFFERTSKVIATWIGQAVQSMTIGLGTSSAFSAMITSTEKPKAKHGAIVGQFVVLGNINSTADGLRPTRIHWSAFGDETDFLPSAATQCDYEDLATGGGVQRIIGGTEYGLIFQEEMVRTMRYVGGQVIFSIQPINYAPGTSIPRSVLWHEGIVYYISQTGFVALDGLNVRYIGKDKIDKYFFDTFSSHSYAPSFFHVAADPQRKIIWWAFPDSAVAYASTYLGYKYDEDRWVRLAGPNTESMGWIRNSTFDPILASFDTSHRICSFAGTGVQACGIIETGALQPQAGRRWQLNNVRVIGDNRELALNADIGVSVRSWDRPDQAVLPSYSTSVPRNISGLNPVRIAGNYLQIRCSISVSPTGLGARYQGLELDYELLGDR